MLAGRVDACRVLLRHRIHHVDLAREQRGDAGRVGLDWRVDDLGDVAFLRAPPVRARHEHGLHADLTLLDHERAGAVGIRSRKVLLLGLDAGRRGRVVLLGPGLAHHVGGRSLYGQNRVRLVQDEVHGQIVDLLHLGDVRDRVGHVGAFSLDALDREDDVIRREGFATVEFSVRTQMEAPGGRVWLLPFRGQRRHQLEIFPAAHERLVHLPEPRQREGLGQRMRIERGRIDAIGVAEGLRIRGCE